MANKQAGVLLKKIIYFHYRYIHPQLQISARTLLLGRLHDHLLHGDPQHSHHDHHGSDIVSHVGNGAKCLHLNDVGGYHLKAPDNLILSW